MLKSKCLQLKVDTIIREPSPGKSKSKLKSQRGGVVEVIVKQKVYWPHEAILGGGASRVKGSRMTSCL